MSQKPSTINEYSWTGFIKLELLTGELPEPGQ